MVSCLTCQNAQVWTSHSPSCGAACSPVAPGFRFLFPATRSWGLVWFHSQLAAAFTSPSILVAALPPPLTRAHWRRQCWGSLPCRDPAGWWSSLCSRPSRSAWSGSAWTGSASSPCPEEKYEIIFNVCKRLFMVKIVTQKQVAKCRRSRALQNVANFSALIQT